jgi:hypothetical protein
MGSLNCLWLIKRINPVGKQFTIGNPTPTAHLAAGWPMKSEGPL